MRQLILLFIALLFATPAAASELVVGEQGSVTITLPNQPNNQKCNIEVKFADGSSQDVEVDPKNPSASVSFTPTTAGTQVIQWDGKMKWRGLKSRPPCEGDGNVSVTVRERAEVLAEREAEAERLRAERAVETERVKLEAERLKAERETRAELERNKQTVRNLIAQIDTNEKKQCAFMWIKAVSSKPERYSNTDALSWASTLMDRYVTGSNPITITPKTITGFERMLDTCNQFFSKEREWRSQTFEPPTGDISCTLGSGAKSTCYWTYRIYANDAWQDATALQAMEAHITSGEKFWATSLPEKPDAKARREKREAEVAQQQAQECKRNPLSYQSCPGYADAKQEQDKREAAAEKKRQQQSRLVCDRDPLSDDSCPEFKNTLFSDKQFKKGWCLSILTRQARYTGSVSTSYQKFFNLNVDRTVKRYFTEYSACVNQNDAKFPNTVVGTRIDDDLRCAKKRGIPMQDAKLLAGVGFGSFLIESNPSEFSPGIKIGAAVLGQCFDFADR